MFASLSCLSTVFRTILDMLLRQNDKFKTYKHLQSKIDKKWNLPSLYEPDVLEDNKTINYLEYFFGLHRFLRQFPDFENILVRNCA